MQLTLADLRARVLARVDGNSLLYPNVEIDTYINEGIKSINLAVGFIQRSVIIPYQMQPNRVFYDIPNEIIFPLRLKVENTYLQPSSLLNIGRSTPQWITDTTSNTNSPVASWVRFGFRKFAVHPASSIGGMDLTMTGVGEPKLLVNASDTINFSNDILSAFDLYASFALLIKESPKEFALASENYKAYLRLLKKLTIWKSWVAPRYWIEAEQPLNR